MGDGRDSQGLDSLAAGRLLRAVLVETPGTPEPSPTGGLSDDGRAGPAIEVAATPSSIPGYSFDRLLGEGGGGTVYRAFRLGSERPLAVKILKARAGEKAAKRAWRELEILEHLRLPCLPRLIDYGEHAGHLYFATEFIEGQHLDQFCKGHVAPHSHAKSAPSSSLPTPDPQEHEPGHPASLPLPTRSRVELLAKVADAVQLLHEHGVIHRDLKPSNIIVDDDGQPMLVDLGLAAQAEADQTQWTMTEDGTPIGTPAFMAPEQARGERGQISTRTDVYGLGATAYLVLTGSTPHDTDTSIHEAVRRVAQDEPRDPRSLSHDMPGHLAAVLRRACERDPQRRYASAAELAADWRRWLNGERVEAADLSEWHRIIRWVAHNPIRSTAVACAALVVLSVLVALGSEWYLRWRPDHIVQDDARTSARVVSIAGNTIKEWHGDQNTKGSVFAKFVDRPAKLGGGRVLVTRVMEERSDDPWGNQVCIWDPSDLSKPKWWTPSTEPELVQPIRRRDSGMIFRAPIVLVDDIFPGADHPGKEIVVVHAHVFSLRCIRVYNLAGEVLYSAWHDGGIGTVHWMSGPGLLAFSGDNAEHEWREMGETNTGDAFTPLVFFAVRPIPDVQFTMLNGPEKDPDPRARVEWYRCPLPPRAQALFQPWVTAPDDPALAPDHVQAHFQLVDRNGAVVWVLDKDGREVPSHTVVSDGARKAWDELNLGEVYLGNLPTPSVGPSSPDAPPPGKPHP